MIAFVLSNWKVIVIALIAVALFAGGWKAGASVNEVKWREAMQAANKKAEDARIKLAEEAADIIYQEAQHEDKVRTQIKYITRTIVQHDNSTCLDPDGVRIWNSASTVAGQTDKPDAPVRESERAH